jgi:hypothetical protein
MRFDINLQDLISLYHLVVQRVEQENEARLVQFVAVVTFNDKSSVRLTSIDDFEAYNEVRPLRSVAVLLNWIFLIRFRDRRYPEKQDITVHFMAPDPSRRQRAMPLHLDVDEGPFYYRDRVKRRKVSGIIYVDINYTARTWGNDVDSLLKAISRR